MTGQNKNTHNQTNEIPYTQNHDRTKQKHTQSNYVVISSNVEVEKTFDLSLVNTPTVPN